MNNTKCNLASLFVGLELGSDGIWSGPMPESQQRTERAMREEVAEDFNADYMTNISKHHSVSVMDYELDRFLLKMPVGARILDVGGCWGWHWRNLLTKRPDICLVIVDFVRPNLHYARQVLSALVERQVALVHADATALPFDDRMFDGFWTVQTFQHIPEFHNACKEAHRVLKKQGKFVNYSLHSTPIVQFAYKILRKKYHKEGMIDNLFYLARANEKQKDICAQIFGGVVLNRYTECLFHPDMKITFSGKEGNWIGRLDAYLGGDSIFGSLFGRQRSIEASKS